MGRPINETDHRTRRRRRDDPRDRRFRAAPRRLRRHHLPGRCRGVGRRQRPASVAGHPRHHHAAHGRPRALPPPAGAQRHPSDHFPHLARRGARPRPRPGAGRGRLSLQAVLDARAGRTGEGSLPPPLLHREPGRAAAGSTAALRSSLPRPATLHGHVERHARRPHRHRVHDAARPRPPSRPREIAQAAHQGRLPERHLRERPHHRHAHQTASPQIRGRRSIIRLDRDGVRSGLPMAGVSARITKRLRRFLSRIAFRLMAFNLLLVFLPVAGILYLGSYEQRLLGSQRRALQEEARLLADAVASAQVPGRSAQEILLARHRLRGNTPDPIRLRVISPVGTIIADSHEFSGPPPPQRANRAKRNILYRAGAALLRPLHLSRTTEQPLAAGDYYESSKRLFGTEIRSALQGESGAVERISPDRRSVTVYVAEPIRVGDNVIGATLASQSTFPILQDLYTVRLGILRIFIISVIVAIIISLLVATTIVRPLRQLRLEAASILDRRGRLRGRFRGSLKHDEIGDLSRALERLTRRLDEHVRFIESFAADVSHEFKNPLASIRTATEMLAEVDEPKQRNRFLRMVELEIARMESLLAGVREITMIDTQLTTEVPTRVDVRGLLERIVDGVRMRCNRSIAIELPN